MNAWIRFLALIREAHKPAHIDQEREPRTGKTLIRDGLSTRADKPMIERHSPVNVEVVNKYPRFELIESVQPLQGHLPAGPVIRGGDWIITFNGEIMRVVDASQRVILRGMRGTSPMQHDRGDFVWVLPASRIN